jgi:hypothetical protein
MAREPVRVKLSPVDEVTTYGPLATLFLVCGSVGVPGSRLPGDPPNQSHTAR